MTIESPGPDEVEQVRQIQMRELANESGKDWAEVYQPGSSRCHELLDRAALLTDLLERPILAHPACVARANWYLLAEHAASALRERYQQVGAEHRAADGPGG